MARLLAGLLSRLVGPVMGRAARPAERRPAPPGAHVVRVLAHVVPSALRHEWLAEWEGELAHRWLALARGGDATITARAGLLLRSLGALPDAMWLRRRHGGDEMLRQDLRYAVRLLSKRPGFSTVVVLTLALCIGANTAIFSVVNGVLLRPLPFTDPDRLVMLTGVPTPGGDPTKVAPWSSYLDYVDIRDGVTTFEHLAAFRTPQVTVTGQGIAPVRLGSAAVTPNLFAALGVRPAIGRGFAAEETQPGAPRVVVLSNALWQSRYGSDAAAVGRVLMVDGEPHTIVGVMPAGFRFPSSVALWRPLVPERPDQFRGSHTLRVVGRLKPGVTRERAESEARVIARQLEERYPEDNRYRSARVEPMRDAVVGNVRPALLILLGAVTVVLLVGCTNLANLFLARAAAREREVAVRTALGAGRGQLLRQFVTESLLLTLLGGALGLLVARWGVQVLVANAPQNIPRAEEIGIDHVVLAFVVGVSVLVGLIFGTLPALQLSRVRAASSLKDSGRGASAGVARRRFRQGLVVSELALAVVLVVGAGLLLKSLWRLQHVDPGFNPDRLLVVQLDLPTSRYDDRARVRAFIDHVRRRTEALPSVQSAAVAFEHPLSPGWTSSFTLPDRAAPAPGAEPEARVRPVTPGYFKTAGIPLLRGRDIDERDGVDAPGVVIVNEAFVRQHFPGQEPIGKRLERASWFPGMPTSYEIIGVVRSEKFLGLNLETDPATYFSFAQFPMNAGWLVVRTEGDPLPLVPALRQTVWEIDRDLPLDNVATTEQLLGDSMAAAQFNTSLLGLFAAVALLLAAIGIYGVLAYTVAQRTNEIGIRMALGAPRRAVVRLVVGQGMMLALGGVGIGLAGALAVTRVLAGLLFDVSTTDPVIFAAVAALLTLVALAAALLPARRASRVDPVIALRAE